MNEICSPVRAGVRPQSAPPGINIGFRPFTPLLFTKEEVFPVDTTVTKDLPTEMLEKIKSINTMSKGLLAVFTKMVKEIYNRPGANSAELARQFIAINTVVPDYEKNSYPVRGH